MPGDEDGELRPLELIVEDPMVAGWPWEYLYDAEDEKFLCRAFYPISRGIFNLFPRNEPLARAAPVRILFVYGASRADPDSSLAEELNRVKHAFKRLGVSEDEQIKMDEMAAIELTCRGSSDQSLLENGPVFEVISLGLAEIDGRPVKSLIGTHDVSQDDPQRQNGRIWA